MFWSLEKEKLENKNIEFDVFKRKENNETVIAAIRENDCT